MSFWTPGTYASLSATLSQPGFSLQSTWYHSDTKAGSAVARSLGHAQRHTNPRSLWAKHGGTKASLFSGLAADIDEARADGQPADSRERLINAAADILFESQLEKFIEILEAR